MVGGITLATGAGAGAGVAAFIRRFRSSDQANADTPSNEETESFQKPTLNPKPKIDQNAEPEPKTVQRGGYVKAIALPGELTIHIFRMDQKFFLSSIEMPRIIPDCHGEGAVASLSFAKLLTVKSLSVQSKVITQIREHHVFDDCVTSNVPWIEENGVVREYIELYSLDEMLPLLFSLGATAEIISVIQREMKNYDE